MKYRTISIFVIISMVMAFLAESITHKDIYNVVFASGLIIWMLNNEMRLSVKLKSLSEQLKQLKEIISKKMG